MIPLCDNCLRRGLFLALAGCLISLGWMAPAQSADTDTEKLRELTEKVFEKARAGFDFMKGNAPRGDLFASCKAFRDKSLGKSGVRTSANERYEAALAYSRCVEDKKLELYGEFGADLAKRGGSLYAADVVRLATQDATEDAKLGLQATEGQKNFMGMNFGVGVGVSYSSKEWVNTATVQPDGTVLVTEQHKQLPRVILEAHYYGVCQKRLSACDDGTFGIGPFFGLAATGDALDAFALGLMFGWKDSSAAASGGGFSIGIGAVLDKNFKELAPGWADGQPAPGGQTTVPLVTSSRWSPLLFFTKTF